MLTVKDLTIEYRTGRDRIQPIRNLDLDVSEGSLVLLLGPSGCGKTSLLQCLAGLLRPAAGAITFDGTDVTTLAGEGLTAYRRDRVGVAFQAFNLVPSLTALENVAAPLWSAGWKRDAAAARARTALETVGLAERLRHRPGDLSGGQQQRVAIARAIVHDPPLVLADEPTAHLDGTQVEGVLEILRNLAAPGRVVIVATHDDRLRPLADRIVTLTNGCTNAPTADVPRRVRIKAGAVIFNQGDVGDLVYSVEKGEVELVRMLDDGTEDVVAGCGPGAYFGELAPLLGFPRSATARAVSDVTLTAYPVTAFRHARRGH